MDRRQQTPDYSGGYAARQAAHGAGTPSRALFHQPVGATSRSALPAAQPATRLTFSKLPGALVLLALLVASAVPGFGAPASQAPQLQKIKEEIGLFESVLNQAIAQTFSGPFGLIDRARGAYLPGYGAVLDFELNLSPSSNLGPFASLPTAQELKQRHATELRRRQQALELAERVLAQFGPSITDLGPQESVAIVIHTVALGEHGLEHSVIVVQASKKTMDAYRANAMDRAAFLKQLAVLEY